MKDKELKLIITVKVNGSPMAVAMSSVGAFYNE